MLTPITYVSNPLISREQCHASDTSEYASEICSQQLRISINLLINTNPILHHFGLFFFCQPDTILNRTKNLNNKTLYTRIVQIKLVFGYLATFYDFPGLKHIYVPERDKEKQIKSSGPNANSYLT